jgi:hypothetical protein
LPTDLRRVINLQQLDSLDLFTTVRLATIEAQSKEEGKAKVYTVEEEMYDYCRNSGTRITVQARKIPAAAMSSKSIFPRWKLRCKQQPW